MPEPVTIADLLRLASRFPPDASVHFGYDEHEYADLTGTARLIAPDRVLFVLAEIPEETEGAEAEAEAATARTARGHLPKAVVDALEVGDEVLDVCAGIIDAQLSEEAVEFAQGVQNTAQSIMQTIEARATVSGPQLRALQNMLRGAQAWAHED